MESDLDLLEMPDIVLEKILSFLSYDEVSKNRLVCKKFDATCKSLLNRGFIMVERRPGLIYRAIKSCLPRRESERRAHPLARHCEILSALETRISIVSMTFMKFIEAGLCCFIPGKIIDEILNVLKVVQGSPTPPRTHDLLQELRDISSMAMEHFEEHIAPNLRISDMNSSLKQNYIQTRGHKIDIIHKELKSIMQSSRVYRQQLTGMKRTVNKLVLKMNKQNSYITYQAAKLREQRRLIRAQSTTITEIKKHLEQNDKKFEDLANEIIRIEPKPTETKASQTNEREKQNVLKDVNITVPPSESPFIIEFKKRFSNSGFEFCTSPQNSYTIKGRDSIKSHHNREYEKKLTHNRRTTISDFRGSVAQQVKHVEESMATTNRKRKLIDLISNVVDAKLPKTGEDSQAEIAQFLRHFPKLGGSDKEVKLRHMDSESRNMSKGKRRLQYNYIQDLSDEIPFRKNMRK